MTFHTQVAGANGQRQAMFIERVPGLAEVILDLGDRGGERVGRGVVLPVRLTHQVLADLAGAHRATVTTLLNDWIYDGILRTDAGGRIVLARPHDVWSLAGYHGLEKAGHEPPPH